MIAVAGSGAFGTALAISLAQNTDVLLWARNPETAAQMQESRENAQRLPGARLPKAITVTADFGSIPAEIPILLAVPMQQLRSTVAALGASLESRPLVACCKGVELSTGLGPTAILSEVAGATPAVLTGPSSPPTSPKACPPPSRLPAPTSQRSAVYKPPSPPQPSVSTAPPIPPARNLAAL